MSLGERIREQRRKKGLSQERLAEMTGVSRQAVTKWEAGQTAPSTENLFRLADIFDVSVDALMGTTVKQKQAAPAEQTDAAERTDMAEQLYRLYKKERKEKAESVRNRLRKHLKMALLILAGYAVIYFGGRLLLLRSVINGEYSLTGWLFGNAAARDAGYLYGWLCQQKLFLCSLLISSVPALFGKYRFGFTTLFGFAAGLLLGGPLGSYPEGAAYGHDHYGWAIWGGVLLLSAVMGSLLERMTKRGAVSKPKTLILWSSIFLACVCVIVLFIRATLF
ncbi:MAG: helix-turn-helix domain-containing protein [Candidatus Merdisoma sp.]